MAERKDYVVFTVGDAGDASVIIPVLNSLRDFKLTPEGQSFMNRVGQFEEIVFSDPTGAGKKSLSKAGVNFTEVETVPKNFLENCRLLVQGTSAKAPGLNLRTFAEMRKIDELVPIVWIEDFYLTGSSRKNLSHEPDIMTVMDQSAKGYAVRARGENFGQRVHALGSPAFDPLASLAGERLQRQQAFMHTLNLEPGQKLVYFSASASNQVNMAETLDPLFYAVKSIGDICLAVRFHPADPNREEWESYVKENCPSAVVDEVRNTSDEILSVGSDLVIVQYSTGGVKACMMGVPTIFLMLKSSQKYQESRGAVWPYFPQLEEETKAAKDVCEEAVVEPVIHRMLTDKRYTAYLAENAKTHFPLDGKATERVVNFLLKMEW